MRKIHALLFRTNAILKRGSFLFVLVLLFGYASAQRVLQNPDVIIGELIKVIPSLKDYKAPEGYHEKVTRDLNGLIGVREELEGPELTYYGSKDKGDPAVQRIYPNGNHSQTQRAPSPGPNVASVILQNFDGMGSGSLTPADPNMCAGPTAVIQTTNASGGGAIRIWNLAGTQILAQTTISTLVAGSGYSGQGDPVVVYDPLADRYLVNEFGNIGGGNPNTMVMMVSQTGNPLGGWFIYKFQVAFFPDYPKWSAWPNAYYATTNDFNTAGSAFLGSSVWAFNKTKMLAGDATAESQRFRIFTGSNGSTGSMPVTISGGSAAPPAGSPGMFMYFNDNDYTADPNDVDSIGILTFQPNFAVPANTVVTYAQAMVAAPFLSGVGGAPSPGTGTYGTLSDRLMFCANYRNFGSTESIVLDHTVDANFGTGGGAKAGVRWYEITRAGATPWTISQQSTYAPDADWRYLGAININSKHQIGMAFNLSSTSKFLSFLFTGRNQGDAPNTMSVQEQMIKAGNAYGTFANRCGDYNSMSIDMVNDSLFWTTAMYGNTAAAWGTRVCQFKIGDCDVLRSDFTSFTQNAPAIPEQQNIIYNNVVSNTGCVAMTNFLLTDTLPTNVTFVSATNGGTYNAGNRVVSWPINLNPGVSQTYQLTVNINAGSYFAPITLLNEPVAGAGIPAGWTATSATGPSNWVSSTASSHSAPNSLFGEDNATAITDFRVATSSALALVSPQPLTLSFWHNFSTEPTWDGGVVEISTNGGTTWTDLGPNMVGNGYNGTLNTAGTNPIRGRNAFTGASAGWIQTRVNLASYASQNALFRFRMTSDDNTAAIGWYVDDINISAVAHVDMRSSLFNAAGVRQSYRDTITLILPPSGCVSQTITSNPNNVSVCTGSPVSFSVTATGTPAPTYQWQENQGAGFANITNGGIYSGATTPTLNISAVTLAMNNWQYRCVVSGCSAPINSSNAVLSVVALSVGGTVSPASSSVCGTPNTGTITLSGQVGSVIRWESATNIAGPYTPIANTTTTLVFNNIAATTYFRAVVQAAGCASANSSIATVTFNAANGMIIVSDVGTTLCAGDPARLTAMEIGGTTPITVTQSSSQTPVAGSVACNAGGITTDNSYWRAYNLSSYTLPGALTITSVKFGIEVLQTVTLTARLYLQTGAAFPGGTRTLISTTTPITLPTQNLTYVTVPITAPVTVNPTDVIVIELFSAGTATSRFFIGSNSAAETGPSYISAAACGIPNPVTLASLGFPNMHIILDIAGTVPGVSGPVTGGTFLWTPAAGLSSTTSNPVAASPATTTTYTVSHNNGAGCTRTAQITLTVNQRPVVTAQPVNVSLCATGSASFSITATGTTLTYQWQESRDAGVTWTNLANVAPYSNVTTTTLTINPTAFTMNGYRYRCVVSGICPPGLGNPNISNSATLTVVALPVVTIAPASPVCGGVAGTNGTALTASGANTYIWSPLTGLYTDAAATIPYTGTNLATVYAAPTVFTIYTVNGTNTATGCSNTAQISVNYTPPAPIVTPNPVSMCLGDPAVRLVSASAIPGSCTVSSGAINIPIPDANATNTQNFTATSTQNVSCIPANATITGISVTLSIPAHTYVADLSFNLKSPGGTVINLFRNLGATGGVNTTYPNTGIVNLTLSSASLTSLASANTPAVGTLSGTYKADILNAISTPFYTLGDPPGYPSTAASWAPMFANAAGAANGNWILAMTDDGAGDIGSLTNWSIKFDYIVGVQTTAATWSPIAGLFTDPAALNAYTGTPRDTVYTRPTPAGVYTYQVRVDGIGPDALPVFSNPAPITITDNTCTGNNLVVSGLPTTGVSVNNVMINGFSHTWSGDVNMLLQSPTGQNVILKGNSQADPLVAATNVNLTFSDAAGVSLPTTSPMASGTYLPTNRNTSPFSFLPPGPANVVTPVFPASPTLATFTGNMNGTWKLFVEDRVGGDVGSISGGFSVTFRYATPGCTSPARTVVVTVNTPITITSQPVNAVVCTDKTTTFSVVATGSSPSYQWQVSTDGGTTWNLITNGGVYSGATTSTLTITAPPVSMNGYQYRCAIAGAVPCPTVFSAGRLLTVNPLPTVVINATPFRNLLPNIRTTLTSTSSPAAAINTWYRNGVVVPGATGSSLVVDVDGQGIYYLRVTDVNGCVNNSNTITIADSTSGRVFISPNPTNGRFVVRYNPTHNNVLPRGIVVYDAMGKRVLVQNFALGWPFSPMPIDLSNHGTGVYWIEVLDANNERLAVGRVDIVR